MNVERVRRICLSFPGVTEQVQWEDDLVFKVAGKMFAMTPLIPAKVTLSFKCTAEAFAELTEREGIIPAPYLARAQWVALLPGTTLPEAELKRRLRQAYDLVVAKLPRKAQAEMRKHAAGVGGG
jgi:predicted DNA-binding protein (MmcQ/YjbR family)